VNAYKNVQLFNNYICAMGCTLATEKRKNPQGAQRQWTKHDQSHALQQSAVLHRSALLSARRLVDEMPTTCKEYGLVFRCIYRLSTTPTPQGRTCDKATKKENADESNKTIWQTVRHRCKT